jgi:deaminated glutathione amidase
MNHQRFVVACIQSTPTDDLAENIDRLSASIEVAASSGAKLIATPEYSVFLHASGKLMRESALPERDHPAVVHVKTLAKRLCVWVVLGSVVVRTAEGNIANRSIVISEKGEIVARYDKIHMFDATLPNGRTIRESSTYAPGSTATVIDSPWGRLGLSICYDLRFPSLYRELAQSGAQLLLVPSAFTKATGTLHWHSLLKARAIENRAYILAPATCGSHPGGHETFGHAMILDPDGLEIAAASELPDVLFAEIDLESVTKARARIPSLMHDRPFELEVVSMGNRGNRT